jgi:succinate-semialdehyde dehydrogenase/glutarate-semialdehyde dehydrogenase
MAIATISPVTAATLKSFDELTSEELEDKLARAGHELSDLGIREFMNAKTVWIGEDADG